MIKYILPKLTPTELLNFFTTEPINRMSRGGKLKVGVSGPLELLSVADYLKKIPHKYLYAPEYIQHYHNTSLKIVWKLCNEGLLTPIEGNSGIYQKFKGNGFDARKADYGYYDFLIYGFPEIIKHYDEAIRPLEVIDLNNGNISIGTCFAVKHNVKDQYLVTAKHCLPTNCEIRMKIFLGFENFSCPEAIYAHSDERVDIAIMKYSDKVFISNKFFNLTKPFLLEDIIVSGFPPIPGTAEALLVTSKGEITAMGNTYHHHYTQIYVNANVKGGSSGSPIINSTGEVVGVVIESPRNPNNPQLQDELRFGTGLTSDMVLEIIDSIHSDGDKHTNIQFEKNDDDTFRIN